MRRLLIAFCLTLCLPALAGGQAVGEWAGIPVQKLEVERLPDMGVPRNFHSLTVGPGGSLYAFGGHTTGFVLLESAEVFRDGKWRALPSMHYPHDGGFFAKLPDGAVMLGGGVAESFGIGQSLGVEVFSPSDDTFNPLGILSSRRALCSALALPDGSVLVSGNWCAQDDMALYLPGRGFKAGKPVTEQRSVPFILPTADGDVLVFGSQWVNGETSGGRWVDCLKGEPFRPALFEEYFPRSTFFMSAENCALGDGTFLIPLTRRADGQLAFARLQGTEFTLLETDHPVPMTLPDGSEVRWDLLQVDRTVRKAYSVGLTSGAGLAVLVLDYDPVLDGGVAGVSLRFAPEDDKSNLRKIFFYEIIKCSNRCSASLKTSREVARLIRT